MNILVYDVAASESGALTILQDFLQEVLAHADKTVRWTFVVSTPELQTSPNVRVFNYPWVKKSWLHRLWFEHLVCPALVRRTGADLIFSLQNITVPHTALPQVLYVHQPLPFVPHRFSLRENRTFWIYQNIISRFILRSIRKSSHVIVQTQWMKKACQEKTGVNDERITVIPPHIQFEGIQQYMDTLQARRMFFYPAGAHSYKNHMLILQACKLLAYKKEAGDFRVLFTLTGNENEYTRTLRAQSRGDALPIDFIGTKSRTEIMELYTRSVLLFPSCIETYGLPLLEARTLGSIVLAAEQPFGREILQGYPNAYFYHESDANALAHLMTICMDGSLPYRSMSLGLAEVPKVSLTSYIIEQTNHIIYEQDSYTGK